MCRTPFPCVGYELPFGKGKPLFENANRVANGVLGGWQLQGILLFRSGLPFTVTMSRDVANTGVGGQRPNRIGSGKVDHPTLEKWFDPSAFVAAPNFTYGNSGLRILIAGHAAHDRFLDVQAVPDSRAVEAAIPLGGFQSAEYAQLLGSECHTGYGHGGACHLDRDGAAANAGSVEADILTT